ncbi:MAG: tetrahydromethanopterin S-methyltransferase subunit D [Methanobacteriaceae archaeon]|jgi:tetrahydromethanopterin S-methyltransferase subunit D|nr:tetrahydromethanopterin S-methyltransferase subunit D [Candidatus Methanorudis spinitermitis]
MDPITLLILIIVGGVLIGGGVHFIPVGGAPAAMATATGVGTGTAMLAAGAGLTGLITAAAMTGQPLYMIVLAGAVGAMMMIGITMLVGNIIYVYGVGIVPASAKVEVDPITGRNQEKFVTSGTEGHGIPTVCFVSGIIGGLLGGAGGGLIYYGINVAMTEGNFVTDPAITAGLAAILAVGVFFINSVIASYNIGGTIEGFHDPKFKRIGAGIISCGIASAVLGLFAILLTGGVV